MKIVSIASEVAPFSKTGGLADVARSLPKAIKRLGHEIIVITPLYGKIIAKEEYDLKLIFEGVGVKIDKEEFKINFWKGFLMEDLPIYFVEEPNFFSKREKIYGGSRENARFLVFDIAALKLLTLLKFKADIIHCHDWHTGLIPYYLKADFKLSSSLKKAKTVYTIHNLAFQFGQNWWEVPAEKKDYGKSKIPRFASPDLEYVNFAKRAILNADVINTVSEQYREEIMTKNFGQDLHRILANRENRLFGIINGIDYNAYNPVKDGTLVKNYNTKTIYRKKVNKEFLQKKLGLAVNREIPLVCVTSRVTFQKGFQLIVKILDQLSRLDVQLVVMGDGEKEYISQIKSFQKKYPKKFAWLPFDQKLENLVYAGSDMFVLPSFHEPCGINQLIAMRYGCVPIVRKVGGLYDTVENYDIRKNQGTGFSFNNFDTYSLYGALLIALEIYKNRPMWRSIAGRAMKQSSSWEIPAKKYITLYRKALSLKITEQAFKPVAAKPRQGLLG
ncbi:MAG: glycogen/starch synthase [Patescibacteria group bacterium]|jgi:starch synthase